MNKSKTISVLCLFFLLFSFPRSGLAHPHVWADYSVQATFNATGLEGFRVRWVFDEMFSAQIGEMVDLGAKKPSPDQVRRIREEAFDNLRHYRYFAHVRIDGRSFEVGEVKDFNAWVKNNRMVYEFFIPCIVPAANAEKTVLFQMRDPESFVDLSLASEQPASLINPSGMEVNYELRHAGSAGIGGLLEPKSLHLRFRK